MASINVPNFTLNNGKKMPGIGMGCWMGEPGGGEAVEIMCKNALKVGYRHFDTASGYGNEEHVGKAIRESGIPREEIFVTTKLWSTHHHLVQEAFDTSLKALDIEYIDLYLMHWPQAIVDGRTLNEDEYPTYVDTWKSMEKLLETGKVKSIGISNFSIKTLEKLLPECKVIPVTNQVQLHPCLPQYELKKYCEGKGILLTAYSPIGAFNPAFFTDPDFAQLAAKKQASPAQIALSWGVQRGTPVIPKSANIERMTQNLTLINLTEEDMEIVDSIHKKPGMHKSLLNAYFSDGVVFGWTYEQLGWDMDKNGVVKST